MRARFRTASAKRTETGCTGAFPCIPPADDKGWRLEGELPVTLNYLTIEFGPSGSAELIRLWIDAMAIR